MKTSVISSEYMKLQEQIYALYDKWAETLAGKTIIKNKNGTMNNFPILPHLELQIDSEDYRSFLQDLFSVLKENKSELGVDLNHLTSLLDDDIINKWALEAITINSFYFSEFAKNNNLPEWLPLFSAEHTIRPFLHKVTAECKQDLPQDHIGNCPVCGEEPRLGGINKEGKKEITCPRCHFSWNVKKVSCAYCGTEEQGQVIILKVEEDEMADIYTCKKCNGYTKVIDSRKLIQTTGPEITDLKTLHLDYIAQEKGYGIQEGKDTH